MKVCSKLILIVLLYNVAGMSQAVLMQNVQQRIHEIQKKYAPDKRTAVLDVQATLIGKSLILKGEVGDPVAKKEILSLVPSSSNSNVIDSILVLPDNTCKEKPFGIITVGVASLRKKPLESSGLLSQALMGAVIKVLKVRSRWAFIQTMDDDYLGWMKCDQFVQRDTKGFNDWLNDSLAIVIDPSSIVYQQSSKNSKKICVLPAGASLKYRIYNDRWNSVRMADGTSGYLLKKSSSDYAVWSRDRVPSPKNIEQTAKTFLGIPYLWGGTSTWAFDCSGFTKTVFKMNGIALPRDADQQGAAGEPVQLNEDLADLRTGDLLFFRKDTVHNPQANITHVGIYLGNKEFIHCAGCVKVNSFDPVSSRYSRNLQHRLVKVKRFLKEK